MPLVQAGPDAFRARELHERTPAALGRVVALVEAPYRGRVQWREMRLYALRGGRVG